MSEISYPIENRVENSTLSHAAKSSPKQQGLMKCGLTSRCSNASVSTTMASSTNEHLQYRKNHTGSPLQSHSISRCCSELCFAHSRMRATRQASTGNEGAAFDLPVST